MDRLLESNNKLWENNNRLWEEVRGLREGQNKLWESNNRLWEEVRDMRITLNRVAVTLDRLTISVEEEALSFIRHRIRSDLGIEIELNRIFIDSREINIYGSSEDLSVQPKHNILKTALKPPKQPHKSHRYGLDPCRKPTA